jgi:hypothetical protein
MRWLTRTTLALAAVAVAAALVCSFFGPGSTTTTTVTQPPLELGETQFEVIAEFPGERELVIPISNPAKVPRRIVGVGEG